MLIGDESRAASDGRVIDAINPATGEVIGGFPAAGGADVDAAVAAAQRAFPAGRAPGGAPARPDRIGHDRCGHPMPGGRGERQDD
jgi:acyl-CoA reductase-like NAD-dependent aldehyde dehydrogenase